MQLPEPPAGRGQGGPGGGGHQGQREAPEDVQETTEAGPQSGSPGEIRVHTMKWHFFLIMHRIYILHFEV